jgi:signal transduction histidine kinase
MAFLQQSAQLVAPSATTVELEAALLQAAILLGMAAYAAILFTRYRKAYFLWFGVAWLLFLLRVGVISAFLLNQRWSWLYWHQVITGWTALALLWAALVFSRQLKFRPLFLTALLVPVGWSYVSIYVLDSFFVAAGTAVLILSAVTAWTGWVFFGHWRRVRSSGALTLAAAMFLWALHHLDYPFLRARGAWTPWGSYLDIVFLLVTAMGLTVLVLDDLERGIDALGALAGGVGSATADAEVLDHLLQQALMLPASRGSAFFDASPNRVRFVRGAGECAGWTEASLPPATLAEVAQATSSGRARVTRTWPRSSLPNEHYAFAAILPVPRPSAPGSALVVVGHARDPFAALDDEFLVALGRRIGAALESAELTRRLRVRTDELSRLSARMIEQHEEERRRLSLELHDETAQLFAAVKLQLGLARERTDADTAERLTRTLELVDAGIHSIRDVTDKLRPTLLDDLGLVPALRSLAAEFGRRSGLDVHFHAPPNVPALSADADLAIFRALQETLSNVALHAAATAVRIMLSLENGSIALEVIDDGRGVTEGEDAARESSDRMGLTGMRERFLALGGDVSVRRGVNGGTHVRARLPIIAAHAASEPARSAT